MTQTTFNDSAADKVFRVLCQECQFLVEEKLRKEFQLFTTKTNMCKATYSPEPLDAIFRYFFFQMVDCRVDLFNYYQIIVDIQIISQNGSFARNSIKIFCLDFSQRTPGITTRI